MFWYCHKRGREVRLEKERLFTEAEIDALNEPSSSTDPLTAETVSVAPMDQVTTGVGSPVGRQPGSGYAPGGSLAKEMAKEANAKPSE